jgi:hypothetical protein
MRFYLVLLLSLLSASANADSFYTVVGFQCDAANDVLLLTYDGAYDLAGETLVRNKKPDQWDLWTLYYAHQTIRKQCRLSDGEYELSISIYNTGSCYDCYGIWANVTHSGKLVFNEGLDGFEGPPTQTFIARAVIGSRDAQPELTRFPLDEFFMRASLGD